MIETNAFLRDTEKKGFVSLPVNDDDEHTRFQM